MRKVLAFDFDGTLTTSDSLAGILLFRAGTVRFLLGLALLMPWIVLSMVGLYDNGRAKERLFSYFFRGMSLDAFNDLCRRFAAASGHILRPEGVETIRQAQADGHQVLIVTASIENWVQPFLPDVPVIGTQIEVENGVLTGRFRSRNCHGEEKVRRLLAVCPHREDYHLTAYGDSRGDAALLALADERHYRPFRTAKTTHSSRLPRTALLLFTLWIVALQLLMMQKYYGVLFPGGVMDDASLQALIGRNFHLSGFDAITYRVLTDWGLHYDVVRHPLLPFLLYPFYLLNQALWWLTGANCAMPITCLLLTVCAVGSVIMFYRTARDLIGLGPTDALLLTGLFSSMAYIMVTMMAPDHFVLSLLLLLWVLHGGCRQSSGSRWREIVGTLLLTGVTLTNGVKALLIGFCRMLNAATGHPANAATGHPAVSRLRTLRRFAICYVLPFCAVLVMAGVQHRLFVLPKEQAQEQYEKEHRAEIMRQARVNHQKYKNAPWVIHKGKPIGYGTPKEKNELSQSLLRWTDTTTPRWDTAVENLFGESMQFHERHVLEDVLVYYRPVLLEYDGWWHYAIEIVLVLLFLAGCWAGRRNPMLWLLLSWAAFDLVMHLGFGFAINEVYIMSAHWLFAVPLAMGFLLQSRRRAEVRKSVRVMVTLLALYLYIYNGSQLVGWLLSPIVPPPFVF